MNTFVSHCATSDMFTGPHRAICCSHIVRKSMIGNMFVGYFNNSSRVVFFECSSEMEATLQLQFSIVWGSLLLWKKVPNCISEDTKKFHTAANRLFPNENLKYHPNDPLGVNGEQYEALNERIDSA
ncbi:hypothetical protein T02_4639 [Trichinella nativa]|uniref:Uncharacterized protein n=1 Tax=Trichinella nativa TaxID=6335 RepID=A0A0V1LAB5_9BILA|nr:hypothetical protein T02_4639 [Trichinella nativa]